MQNIPKHKIYNKIKHNVIKDILFIPKQNIQDIKSIEKKCFNCVSLWFKQSHKKRKVSEINNNNVIIDNIDIKKEIGDLYTYVCSYKKPLFSIFTKTCQFIMTLLKHKNETVAITIDALKSCKNDESKINNLMKYNFIRWLKRDTFNIFIIVVFHFFSKINCVNLKPAIDIKPVDIVAIETSIIMINYDRVFFPYKYNWFQRSHPFMQCYYLIELTLFKLMSQCLDNISVSTIESKYNHTISHIINTFNIHGNIDNAMNPFIDFISWFKINEILINQLIFKYILAYIYDMKYYEFEPLYCHMSVLMCVEKKMTNTRHFKSIFYSYVNKERLKKCYKKFKTVTISKDVEFKKFMIPQ